MYKIDSPPSPRANINELADFVEVKCLASAMISKHEIISILQRLDEVDLSQGHQIDDPLENRVDEAFVEIENRKKVCPESYPFLVDDKGFVAKVDNNTNSVLLSLYCFLLFATRLNMKTQKIQNEVDGALLFEEISLEVAKEYLGPRSKTFLFGTSSNESSFQSRINQLCNELNEGGGFATRNAEAARNKKDDTLDIVVWKPFSDNYPGKLAAFGQCKTGTSWEDTLAQLQPSSFINSWFIDSLAVEPVRMFFITDLIANFQRHHFSTKAGIIFDRLRILDFAPRLDQTLFAKVKSWTSSLLKSPESQPTI